MKNVTTYYKEFDKALKELRDKYPDELFMLNGIAKEQLDESSYMDKIIDAESLANISIDPTSNVGQKDIEVIIQEITKPRLKLKSTNRLFKDFVKIYGLADAKKWLEFEITGKLYMHDSFEASFKNYCYNYSCERIAKEGTFFDSALKAKPASHLQSFNEHILEFIRYATKNQSGAVGIADFLVWSFYFYNKDKKENYLGITDWDKYRDQNFQMFIYSVNQSGARVGQSAFTNVSLYDRKYLIGIFGSKQYPDDSLIIDYSEEIIQYQKDFLNCIQRERHKKLLTFPILNGNLLFKDGEFKDKDFFKFCAGHIYEWKDLPLTCFDSVSVVSGCCRLVSDMDTLGLFNSITGASSEIGSVKVSSVNFNRLALEANGDRDKFLELLKEATDINLKILHAQRVRIGKNIEKGLLPLYNTGMIKLENQYSTYGIISFADMMENLNFLKTDKIGNQYYSDEGYKFAQKIFDIINQSIKDAKFDFQINKEAVPAENAAVNLAKKDKLFFKNIDTKLYSNQWISLDKNATITEKVKSASKLDKECSGGSMLFINVEGEFTNKKQVADLIKDIAAQGVTTINIVGKINICRNEHNYRENTETCPICGADKVDEAIKIVGFYSRVSNWSKERKAEDRRYYNFEN